MHASSFGERIFKGGYFYVKRKCKKKDNNKDAGDFGSGNCTCNGDIKHQAD